MTQSNKKTILITGAGGFIGHHVVDYYLRETTHDIVIIDRLDVSGTLNRLAALESFDTSRVRFVWHDLKAAINEFVSAQIGVVDDVIHLAAASHVDRSIEDPLSFVMDNVVGTTNLLIWAKEGGMRSNFVWRERDDYVNGDVKYTGKFINFSTDEVFGPAPFGYNHRETDPYFPSNPYAATKASQSSLGYAFYITYGLPVVTTYTMNNYGTRQHPEKLIPKAIRSISEGVEMPVFAELDGGVLKAVGSRFWINTQDTARAIDFLLHYGAPGEAYNVVGTDELTNLQVCEIVAEELGLPLKAKFVDFHASRPGHDRRYALDGSKLQKLGWKPQIKFRDGIRDVIAFVKNNPQWI